TTVRTGAAIAWAAATWTAVGTGGTVAAATRPAAICTGAAIAWTAHPGAVRATHRRTVTAIIRLAIGWPSHAPAAIDRSAHARAAVELIPSHARPTVT